jgi:hypothetical protein
MLLRFCALSAEFSGQSDNALDSTRPMRELDLNKIDESDLRDGRHDIQAFQHAAEFQLMQVEAEWDTITPQASFLTLCR